MISRGLAADSTGPDATIRENFADAKVARESRTVATNEKEPATVGVPDIAAVAAFNVSPAGKCPYDTIHVYGGTPCPAVRTVAYLLCTVASGIEIVATRRESEAVDVVGNLSPTPTHPPKKTRLFNRSMATIRTFLLK
jgi:hypothetical protein